MTTATLTLTDFLLARIAEDEEVAREALSRPGGAEWWGSKVYDDGVREPAVAVAPAHVLAECDARRRIVAEAQDALAVGQHMVADDVWSGRENAYEEVLQFLALPYADHPDYRREWRP